MTLEGRWGGVREGGGWRVEEIVKRIALSNQAIANSLPAERLSRECTGKVKKDDFTEYWPRKKGSSLNSKNPNILTIIHRWRPTFVFCFSLRYLFASLLFMPYGIDPAASQFSVNSVIASTNKITRNAVNFIFVVTLNSNCFSTVRLRIVLWTSVQGCTVISFLFKAVFLILSDSQTKCLTQ